MRASIRTLYHVGFFTHYENEERNPTRVITSMEEIRAEDGLVSAWMSSGFRLDLHLSRQYGWIVVIKDKK